MTWIFVFHDIYKWEIWKNTAGKSAKVQPKCFWHPKHMINNWQLEKTGLSHQVWSHGGSTLKKKEEKKDIKELKFPPCRNWPIYSLLEECRRYVLVSNVMAKGKIGSEKSATRCPFDKGRGEAIWEMSIYTDHFSKRGFPKASPRWASVSVQFSNTRVFGFRICIWYLWGTKL